MKLKFTSLVLALAMVAGIGAAAHAQSFGMMTSDLVTLKIGFTPLFERSFENESDGITDEMTLSSKGVNIGAEYAVNLGEGMFLGFGLEYLYAVSEGEFKYGYDKSTVDLGEANLQFLSPMVTFKYVLAGGLYLGAGVSGRYLISADKYEKDEVDYGTEKAKFDVWGNAVAGFIFPVSDGVYLDMSGRFGYNFTQNQGTELKNDETKYDSKGAYDLAVYVGVAFRPTSTGL